MRCVLVFVFLISIGFSTKSAFANVLSLDDFKPYIDLQQRVNGVRKEISAILTSSQQSSPTGPGTPTVPIRGCAFQLEENLEVVSARFDYTATMVGFAARMKDHDDELLVLGILDTVAANCR